MLNFLIEPGPPAYTMTDKDGWELSDRWQEDLTIKDWIEEIWSRLNVESRVNQDWARASFASHRAMQSVEMMISAEPA
ncbi:MAG: hypothetical protein GDA49_10925 [Rhodospirillales bacterium]|nr:hypothetical protein [Rhodospirillales bacterium]